MAVVVVVVVVRVFLSGTSKSYCAANRSISKSKDSSLLFCLRLLFLDRLSMEFGCALTNRVRVDGVMLWLLIVVAELLKTNHQGEKNLNSLERTFSRDLVQKYTGTFDLYTNI